MNTKRKKKARMGRPSMGRDARIVAVIVKISANEKQEWQRAAAAEDLPLGPWLLKPRREQRGK
jgi:hypothetical protein